MSFQSRKTPLFSWHRNRQARMVSFAGWCLPLRYDGSLAEARAVRDSCGIFDVSHMGHLSIRGSDAPRFLQRMTSNDVEALAEGRLQYTLFLSSEGTVLDDCILGSLSEEYLCVVNAVNRQKILHRLRAAIEDEDVSVADQTEERAFISVQGPASAAVVEKAVPAARELEYMSVSRTRWGDHSLTLLRSGYTGELGFEISLPAAAALRLWELLCASGEECGMRACGLGARDILRIEAGYPLYGQEIDENTRPFAAGVGWAVKMGKADFIGRSALAGERAQPGSVVRTGIVLERAKIARTGYPVYAAGRQVGTVTSGTFSPALQKSIAMVRIESGYAQAGQRVVTMIRGQAADSVVTDLPFVPIHTKQKGIPCESGCCPKPRREGPGARC
ncbi:MAG: glycine cleavage system aminomethyltransferase GcvT [Candidatus Omnitrophica bacterium]|nr:glycine cleavage system aminomethyltransferase GcvT [Candidatus Omnitrophota bacterium]